MAEFKKVIKGKPFTYITDLSHKYLGKFDENGEFGTNDKDTIIRLNMMKKNAESLKKKSLGVQLQEKDIAAKYAEYKKLAEVMCDVLEERAAKSKAKDARDARDAKDKK